MPAPSSRSIGRLFRLIRPVTGDAPRPLLCTSESCGGVASRWWGTGGRPHLGACDPGLRCRWTARVCVCGFLRGQTCREGHVFHSTLFQSTGRAWNPASLDPTHSTWIANDGTTCFRGSVRSVAIYDTRRGDIGQPFPVVDGSSAACVTGSIPVCLIQTKPLTLPSGCLYRNNCTGWYQAVWRSSLLSMCQAYHSVFLLSAETDRVPLFIGFTATVFMTVHWSFFLTQELFKTVRATSYFAGPAHCVFMSVTAINPTNRRWQGFLIWGCPRLLFHKSE